MASQELSGLLAGTGGRVLAVKHVEERGRELFDLVCAWEGEAEGRVVWGRVAEDQEPGGIRRRKGGGRRLCGGGWSEAGNCCVWGHQRVF